MNSHRAILVSIALVIAAVVFGCVVRVRESTPEARLARIRPGMCPDEVRQIMGRGPDWWGRTAEISQGHWFFRDGRFLVATFEYGQGVDPERIEVTPDKLRAVEIWDGRGGTGGGALMLGSWRTRRLPQPEGQPSVMQHFLDWLQSP